MSSGDSPNRRLTISNRAQDVDNPFNRCGRCRDQKRSRAATRMEIADDPKGLCRGFHRVEAERAVHVKIDKTWREVVSGKVNNIFSARVRLLTNCGDFSASSDDFEAIANLV